MNGFNYILSLLHFYHPLKLSLSLSLHFISLPSLHQIGDRLYFHALPFLCFQTLSLQRSFILLVLAFLHLLGRNLSRFEQRILAPCSSKLVRSGAANKANGKLTVFAGAEEG
ncbi:hypothetical protein K1719_021292 [Acacia pycnantha]|nr:hypothetical protein K1719_021292 [Acacia pycnantha]